MVSSDLGPRPKLVSRFLKRDLLILARCCNKAVFSIPETARNVEGEEEVEVEVEVE